MRIAFVVERPTQFEAPFFRHAAADPEHRLRVLFTRPDPGAEAFDPELGRAVSWGIDLLGGYDWSAPPARGPLLATSRWLAAELAPERCDLAVVNGYTQGAYALATLAARRAGVPVALRLDSVRFGAEPTPRERARRLLFAGLLDGVYDLFLGVGTLTLEYLDWCGIPEERRGLLPYAIDVERFRAGARLAPPERETLRQRLGVPAGARAVLSVAKLHPRESPWDLLRAMARLGRPEAMGGSHVIPTSPPAAPATKDETSPSGAAVIPRAARDPGGGALARDHSPRRMHGGGSSSRTRQAESPDEIVLLVAGDGPERPALEGFAAERLAGRVRFLGYVPYPELPALYGAADLFVHPAREERWGVSVAEALAAGLPVVASSRVGAARDLLAAGINGFTYETGDDADLARRIGQALALDPEEVRSTSDAILPRWGYAAAWRTLLAAAARAVSRRQGGLP